MENGRSSKRETRQVSDHNYHVLTFALRNSLGKKNSRHEQSQIHKFHRLQESV